MRKSYFLVLIFLIWGCGGSISDEQRKQMLKAKDEQSIIRVSDAQITEAAFEKGRQVVGMLNDTGAPPIDSLSNALGVKIRWLVPGSKDALEIEKQIIDAYINSVLMGDEQKDNVQNIGSDSLLYTKPIVITRPDSSVEVKGTWNIWLSKRNLVLSLGKK